MHSKLNVGKTGENALAIIAVLVTAVAFVHFNPLSIGKSLEEAEVIDCDGQSLQLDG